MYLFDFVAQLFKKKSVGTIIWLIINTVIVTAGFGYVFAFILINLDIYEIPDWALFASSFLIYVLSIAVALSPIGEFILRLQTGCRKIADPAVYERIERLFNEVRERAAVFDPNLNNREINFFMSDDEAPNAFATGRKTVCITKGLLSLSDEEIKGVLAHEFGHLSHKDTDALLIIEVGNIFVWLFFLLFELLIRGINWLLRIVLYFVVDEDTWFMVGLNWLADFLIHAVFGAVMWLWTKLGVLICMSSSRKNEYLADKFACDLGYGLYLKQTLLSLEDKDYEKSMGLWATLASSHPDTASRVSAIDNNMLNPTEPKRQPSYESQQYAEIQRQSESEQYYEHQQYSEPQQYSETQQYYNEPQTSLEYMPVTAYSVQKDIFSSDEIEFKIQSDIV